MSAGPGRVDRALLHWTGSHFTPTGRPRWGSLVEIIRDEYGCKEPTPKQVESFRRSAKRLDKAERLHINYASADRRSDLRPGTLIVCATLTPTLTQRPEQHFRPIRTDTVTGVVDRELTRRATSDQLDEADAWLVSRKANGRAAVPAAFRLRRYTSDRHYPPGEYDRKKAEGETIRVAYDRLTAPGLTVWAVGWRPDIEVVEGICGDCGKAREVRPDLMICARCYADKVNTWPMERQLKSRMRVPRDAVDDRTDWPIGSLSGLRKELGGLRTESYLVLSGPKARSLASEPVLWRGRPFGQHSATDGVWIYRRGTSGDLERQCNDETEDTP